MGRKSARFIARACGVSTEQVYQMLAKMGYVKRILGKWFINEEGEKHGQYSSTQFEVPIWDEETQRYIFNKLTTCGKKIDSREELLEEEEENK